MTEGKLVSAAAMAYAVERDPQFHLPQSPRFADSLVVIPMTDGLLIEGTMERQVFRGRAATSLLPRLFPLMDGTRTSAEIVAALPDVPPQAIKNALALLYTRGVLEDAAADQGIDSTGFSAELVDFFRRHVDMTRVNPSASCSLSRLHSARIAIVGEGIFASLLVAELGRSGITSTCIFNSGADLLDRTIDLVVVLVRGQENRSELAQLDDLCATLHIPWLRAALVGTDMEIGPYFERDENRCYRCFEAVHDWSFHVEPSSQPHERAWISLVATEIVYLISRICPPITGPAMLQFNLSDWSQTSLRLPKLPGCPYCCPIPGHRRGEIHLALAYEQAVTTPSKKFLNPKDHQLHYRIANLELQRHQKLYQSAPYEYLPKAEETPIPTEGFLSRLLEKSSIPQAPLKRETLTGLLLRGGGLRNQNGSDNGRVLRWAPTGGNLGSVQIYVLAKRVQGLQSGCYFYQPYEHALALIRSEQTEAEFQELMEGAVIDTLDTDFAALLVLTAAHTKVEMKYGAFTYRLVHLDAGVAIAQLHAVTQGYGLLLKVANCWNDQLLLAALGLNGNTEPITAVVAIYDKPCVD